MDAPTNADRDRRAADLRSRAALVRANGWAPYENMWSSGEVAGVRAVLGEPGALDAAVEQWAPTLWGAAAAEADERTGYRSTRRWFAAVAGVTSERERVRISAPRMVDLRPRIAQLLSGGWRMVRMDKPVAEGCGQDVNAWFERGLEATRRDTAVNDDMEMTGAEKASLAASRAAIGDLAHALVEGTDPETAEAALAAVRQANTKLDLDALRDKLHVPGDAGEYEDGLRRIMLRIPDGWGRWIGCSRGWYPIVIELDQQLAAIDAAYEVTQCKEKLSGLRYYFAASEGVSEADQQRMRELVREAEAQAEITCELCGEPGVRHARSSGWLKTLCSDCASSAGYEPLGELVNDLTPDRRGLWRVTCYGGDESHWDMTRGEVSIVGGDRHRDFEVLALPSVLRTWRIRLAEGSEIESGLIAAIERVR